jgi:hypothetical protein
VHTVDITPASLDQVIRGRGGELLIIENDVNGVARDIGLIHPDLFLRYNMQGDYFVVLQNMGDGVRPHVVTTAQECDQRLVRKVQAIVQGHLNGTYDYGTEVERHHDERDRVNNAEFTEKMGEVSEKLAWAIRTDIRKGRPGPIYVPPDILPYRKYRK